MSSKFRPGDRVRVARPEYGTFDRIGTVTDPDEFWTFGPCVVLDGDAHGGAYLDDDLEFYHDEAFGPVSSPAETAEPTPEREPELEPKPFHRPHPEAVCLQAVAEPQTPASPVWPEEPEARHVPIPAETDVRREPSPRGQPVADRPIQDSVPAVLVSAETDEQRAQREWDVYQRGIRDGWGEAVRHVAYRARVEGGALGNAGTIAPELNGLIAGILARIESAEARALVAEANLGRRDERALLPAAPEPERPSLSAQTLTTLIQAVSEIVIQERERARLQWQAKLEMAEARAEAERARRLASETENAELRRRAEPPQLPAILQEGAIVEVLSCAEEYISGGRHNRALVLHALRETLSHIRQASAYDALIEAAQPRKAVGGTPL